MRPHGLNFKMSLKTNCGYLYYHTNIEHYKRHNSSFYCRVIVLDSIILKRNSWYIYELGLIFAVHCFMPCMWMCSLISLFQLSAVVSWIVVFSKCIACCLNWDNVFGHCSCFLKWQCVELSRPPERFYYKHCSIPDHTKNCTFFSTLNFQHHSLNNSVQDWHGQDIRQTEIPFNMFTLFTNWRDNRDEHQILLQ